VGSELIMRMCKDPELMPGVEGLQKAMREPMLKVFPAALLGRLVMIPYFPLSDDMLKKIIRLQMGRIERRIRENHDVEFSYTDEVVDHVAGRCTEVESGGRMVDAILTNTMLPAMSQEFLKRMIEGRAIERVGISIKDGDFAYSFDG
jgi:type VI secretion system protein VasG